MSSSPSHLGGNRKLSQHEWQRLYANKSSSGYLCMSLPILLLAILMALASLPWGAIYLGFCYCGTAMCWLPSNVRAACQGLTQRKCGLLLVLVLPVAAIVAPVAALFVGFCQGAYQASKFVFNGTADSLQPLGQSSYTFVDSPFRTGWSQAKQQLHLLAQGFRAYNEHGFKAACNAPRSEPRQQLQHHEQPSHGCGVFITLPAFLVAILGGLVACVGVVALGIMHTAKLTCYLWRRLAAWASGKHPTSSASTSTSTSPSTSHHPKATAASPATTPPAPTGATVTGPDDLESARSSDASESSSQDGAPATKPIHAAPQVVMMGRGSIDQHMSHVGDDATVSTAPTTLRALSASLPSTTTPTQLQLPGKDLSARPDQPPAVTIVTDFQPPSTDTRPSSPPGKMMSAPQMAGVDGKHVLASPAVLGRQEDAGGVQQPGEAFIKRKTVDRMPTISSDEDERWACCIHGCGPATWLFALPAMLLSPLVVAGGFLLSALAALVGGAALSFGNALHTPTVKGVVAAGLRPIVDNLQMLHVSIISRCNASGGHQQQVKRPFRRVPYTPTSSYKGAEQPPPLPNLPSCPAVELSAGAKADKPVASKAEQPTGAEAV